MITPQELDRKMNNNPFTKDMENALKIVEEEVLKALDEGKHKIMIPTHMKLGDLFFIVIG